MPSTRQIERRWIENFKSSNLIDKTNNKFNTFIAKQFFNGKTQENYPSDFPENFKGVYNEIASKEKEEVVEILMSFLNFVGIKMTKANIITHIEKFPNDYATFTKKCFFIFKAIGHFEADINLLNPYRDNGNDIFFLARIESQESLNVSQLNMFVDTDTELPVLYKKLSNLPDNYEDDGIAMNLFRRIENSNDSFFITGKAGTGKSTFIHYFAQKTQKKVLMTAFTGIASVNVGGQTIHSFFGFPIKPLLPEDDEIKKFHKESEKYKIIQKIDTIIIDEVSMLRSDILEAIDYSLRINGGNPNLVFGGKQIIFVGDIFQLPPVLADEIEGIQFEEIYKSEYFFDSPAYKKLNPKFFEFKISYRQKEDIPFVELLDLVRMCNINRETLNKLNTKFNPHYIPKAEDFVITLTSNNKIANEINTLKLRELIYSDVPPFQAKIEGDFPVKKYPTLKELELKKNAQVIFIKNDTQKRWVNGTIAKISFITKDFIEVRLQDGKEYRIERETWENRRYKYNREVKKVVSEVIGTFEQFPLKLAWAITIHKSQGLTFDNVIIELGTGAFVNGQVYTALSRCRTFDKICLKSILRFEDIISDKRLISFHETEQILNSINEDENS